MLALLVTQFTHAATLQEQLEQAVSAFGQGDYASSYWQFESMELDYGTEPEFLARNFQQIVLPVRGYAALMADRPTDALIYFGELLSQYDPHPGLQAFALYNAAIAQSQTHALAAAAQTFHNFQLTFPGSNEAALALLQEAELRYEIGEVEQATERLDTFYASDAPETLRMQARLRALQIAGETGSTERARDILFNSDWNVAAMPDIAVLSFAALDAGDLLLSEGHYSEAVRAYRLTLPRNTLIETQRERLQTVQAALAQQSRFASSIWKSHSQQLVARLTRQLDRLEHMADYTPGLYLRSGQAYLLGQRFREAAILFRTVAQTSEFETDIRAEAHYRWILTLCEAEDWQTARTTAQQFLDEHPAHKLANSALFLIARAYQGEGQYLEAIAVLDDLIDNFPDDKQAPRWYFTRGYNYSVLERQATARANFETALERHPKSSLVEQLKMWRGLTYFFERDYPASLDALTNLKKTTKKHPLYPEINYRIANITYAQRDYAAALKTADALIQQFPDHHRVPEAQALRGDIFMGQGELIRAADAFRQVPPDDAQLYDYAIFQASKIYKALERYDLLRKHLQAYIDRDDANERPRVSEALYWIGWSLQQEARGTEAFPLFEEALTRFGNDPKARAVGSILSAYADLYKRLGKTDSTLSAFETWLQDATEKSLAEGQLTWFARLTLFSSNRQRRTLGDERAEATLLSIHRFVPIDQQDAETLASVGLVLIKRGYESADDYCEQLLTEFPKRFERGTAYFGKAQLAANAKRLEKARRWLLRFLEETPTHPLAADVRLLTADILTRQGIYEGARDVLNEILQIKEMRGRPHARALAGLARIETEQNNPERAIPYWQRIYTLYRAYPEIIIDAYWESALLFEQISDSTAARNTLRELLSDERLQDYEAYQLATAKLPELEAIVQTHNELAIQAAKEARQERAPREH
ncbi:MAG: tetratricopeptide (TPR) repeat protein [Yoonia sp.]|jgi:tetratricopeptide (TPR) repeat protein